VCERERERERATQNIDGLMAHSKFCMTKKRRRVSLRVDQLTEGVGVSPKKWSQTFFFFLNTDS